MLSEASHASSHSALLPSLSASSCAARLACGGIASARCTGVHVMKSALSWRHLKPRDTWKKYRLGTAVTSRYRPEGHSNLRACRAPAYPYLPGLRTSAVSLAQLGDMEAIKCHKAQKTVESLHYQANSMIAQTPNLSFAAKLLNNSRKVSGREGKGLSAPEPCESSELPHSSMKRV